MSKESDVGGAIWGLLALLFMIVVPVLAMWVYAEWLLRRPARAVFIFLSLFIFVGILIQHVSQTSTPIIISLTGVWLILMFITSIIVLIANAWNNRTGGGTEEWLEDKYDMVNSRATIIGFLLFFYSWFLMDIGTVWSSEIAQVCLVLGYLMAIVGSMTLIVSVFTDKTEKFLKSTKNTKPLN